MAACQAHVSSLIKNGATDDIIGASVKTHLLCQQALASDKEPLERLWSAIQQARFCRQISRSACIAAIRALCGEMGVASPESNSNDDRIMPVLQMCIEDLEKGIETCRGGSGSRNNTGEGTPVMEEQYAIGVGLCCKGLLNLDIGETLVGHEVLLEGLGQWHRLSPSLLGGESRGVCVGVVEKAMFRHSLDILGDYLLGQGPAECQARVVDVSANMGAIQGQ